MAMMTDSMARHLYHLSCKCFSGKRIKSAFSNLFLQEQHEAFKGDEDLIAKFDNVKFAELHLCTIVMSFHSPEVS